MAYVGDIFDIPLGAGGLYTDDSQDKIPKTYLIKANNVQLQNGVVEKDSGSKRWNTTTLGSGVVAAFEFYPDDNTQLLIVCTKNGKVYKFTDRYTFTEVTASGAAPANLIYSGKPVIVAGGIESANRNRKLFIFSGGSPVQVISGNADVRTNIANPAADWATKYPTFGIIHRGRLWALGNDNDRHRVYASDAADHEVFNNGQLITAPIYPGEAEKLLGGFVWKGRIFFFKYPYGVYYVEDSDPNAANWAILKASSSFGVASPRAIVNVLDDLLAANSSGSITSVKATQAFGDIESGDLLRILRNENYMRHTTSQSGLNERDSIYYEAKKQVFFAYRSSSGSKNDRILMIDYALNEPRITWINKDQPNCFFLRKDILGVERPFYGADDGYVYEMDLKDREVEGSAFTAEFQTPHLDFGSTSNKQFDFLEMTFEPTGRWNLSVEVIIDGRVIETIPFSCGGQGVLDVFVLDRDRLQTRIPQSIRKPLHGMGRRISFRCYNSGFRQNIKICKLSVHYRNAGQEQKGAT